MPEQTRQLAAIMFTDIVGYTALMGKNSSKALDLVQISKEIQKPLVERHNGQWLKEMGDGALAKFNTALDAVNCAVEIQELARAKFDGKIRIGIHLGDVSLSENDVYGDGVNVAARLESVADPGGIYISDAIEKAIRGQSNIQAKYLGESQLKNVDYGVRTYALQGVGLPVPDIKEDKQLTGRFFAELERRNVIRPGIMYVLISLLLVLLLPLASAWITFPDSFNTILLTVLGIGFPIAIFLAWRYERSPEGFVRSSSDKSWQNPLNASQRKPLTGNIFMGSLAVVILILFIYQGNTSDAKKAGILQDVSLQDKSIAVLPFSNLSADAEQEYFSDGITEDILNHLSKIADLKVKSRTSTLQYKGTQRSIPDIGRELGVSNILEGSVRKSGNMVRIVAQLINVDTDEHIWSETYDRELTEVFAIQSEVAIEIARVLEAKLTTSEQNIISKEATDDITAYDYYLKARQIRKTLGNNQNRFEIAIQLIDQAIALDPNFALAYSFKARLLYGSRGWRTTREVWLDSTLRLIDQAIALNPDAPEPYILRHQIYLRHLGDLDQSSRDLQKAYDLDPNNPAVLEALGDDLIRQGEYDRGSAMIISSLELEYSRKDPEFYIGWGDLYRDIKELEAAEGYYLQAQRLAPAWRQPVVRLAQLARDQGEYHKSLNYCEQGSKITGNLYADIMAWDYFMIGDLDKAEEYWLILLEAEESIEDSTQFFPVRHRLAQVKLLRGEKQAALDLMREQLRLNKGAMKTENVVFGTGNYYDLAVSELFLGSKEEAYKSLDLAWETQSWLGMWWLDHDPLFDSLRSEKRFTSFVAKVKSREDQIAAAFRKHIREKETSDELKLVRNK